MRMKQENVKLHGFTLVEMSIVLVIVGLLIGGGFSTFSAYTDNAKQSHTQGNLQVTKRAMLDYVLVNRHMPCPDTDDDGSENREADFSCTGAAGTVPFNDIGLGVGVTSDDWNNVFAYGINTDVIVAANVANVDNSASYFSSENAPVFDLQTPPTVASPTVAESYTVCKKSAAACNATATNVEVDAIPAVIVAFNQNGSATSLAACNSETGSEAENCDGDLLLWKRVFSDGAYDDQMVTISGYEIKQQILDLLNNITLDTSGGGGGVSWEAYDYIINKHFVNSNELNVADSVRNTFLITGDVMASGSINLKAGNDVLAIMGTIEIDNVIKGKEGFDVLLVSNSVDGYPPASSSDADTLAALKDAIDDTKTMEIVCYIEDLNTCYSNVDATRGLVRGVDAINTGNTSGTPVVFP